MRGKKTFVGVALLVAILMLGIGYAAISNITLNIKGTAAADPSDSNFVVKFTGEPTVSSDKVSASVTDDLNASITVTGLTAKGDNVTATYTITNASEDLGATLSATTTNTNENYFNVSYEFDETSVAAKGTTTITVTVELLKTPVSASESADIGVILTAAPVQP